MRKIEKLKNLLETIKKETEPSKNHPEPKELIEHWNECFRLVNSIEEERKNIIIDSEEDNSSIYNTKRGWE